MEATAIARETKEIGEKLVDLCKKGKSKEAQDTLYDKNIVSVEATPAPGMQAESKGMDAIRKKTEWWEKNHEIHSSTAEGPFVNGDKFAVIFQFDVTATGGPMKGKRFNMREIAVYTVKNGKIAREEFLY